jgi:benzoyl-CoA reductase/2-hydroxyglutaryl-CoA dehydratase subunit BcrC/BadD/HgdB
MAQTIGKIQTHLMRDYYKYFSKYAKGKSPDCKVAWVTSFTPVEILEALGILYYYPESYAAVIAASEKEQDLLIESENQFLVCDCCSYSCCIEGCVSLESGPRGMLPKPDVLIATNNQCNTLPNWWNILARRYNVPLIVIDYPGESVSTDVAYEYVTAQHRELVTKLEELSGNRLEENILTSLISNSAKSIRAWGNVVENLKTKDIKATMLFDDINYLITARCKEQTFELYEMMADELSQKPDAANGKIPVFWLGYPLWYHKDRFLSEVLGDYRIVGSNYVTWWNLEYSGNSNWEKLFNAYNYTFLNLTQKTRDERLAKVISTSGARCAVSLHNKSCKCDFVSARNIEVPQVELEIDMIDRNFLDVNRAKEKMELLKTMVD